MAWSKKGGLPVPNLPRDDTEPNGTVWSDLVNNPAGRAALGWVEVGAPATISRMQARLALNAAGLLDAIEAAIAAAPRTVQIYWEDVSELHRDHPLIEQIAGVAGLSEEQVDDLFIAAKQIG